MLILRVGTFPRPARAGVALAAVLAAGLALPPAAALAGRVEIAGRAGESYGTIGQALAAARDGDTVVVAPGIYREQLLVNKRVSLVGNGLPTIVSPGPAPTVALAVDGISIQGFRLVGKGHRLGNEAILLVASSGNLIQDNTLEGELFGIYLREAHGNTIRHNLVQGNPRVLVHDRGNGIHLANSHGNRLQDNYLESVRDGIYVQFSNDNLITGNTVVSSRIGLHYMYSDYNHFEANTFYGNAVGGAIMYSRRITLAGNLFRGSTGPSGYGLLLKDCADSLGTDNVMAGNTVGIFLDLARLNTMAGNVISGNHVGVEINASSEGNLFTGNTFAGNGEDVRLSPGRHRNSWDDGHRGNFWSSYRGYDLDADGLGDVPHRAGSLFGYLAGKAPEVNLLAGSPALHALSVAERALPVLDMPVAEDHHPLMSPLSPRYTKPSALPLSSSGKGSGPRLLMALASAALAFTPVTSLFPVRRRRGQAR